MGLTGHNTLGSPTTYKEGTYTTTMLRMHVTCMRSIVALRAGHAVDLQVSSVTSNLKSRALVRFPDPETGIHCPGLNSAPFFNIMPHINFMRQSGAAAENSSTGLSSSPVAFSVPSAVILHPDSK
jgi:hypothetical protein